jgi:hypothetical protein
VLISGDRNIRTKPHQRQILEKAGVLSFFLAKGYDHQELWQRAVSLLAAFPNIRAMAEKKPTHLIYRVQMNGKVEPF